MNSVFSGRKKDTFFLLLFLFSIPLILLIILPLGKMVTGPDLVDLARTIKDPQVTARFSGAYTHL